MSNKEIPKIKPFNPLDKKNLGESVAEALLEQQPQPLPPDKFIGAGIYTIYYTGTFELYSKISKCNTNEIFSWPIYVGKAVPKGARKGGFKLDANPGSVLYQRLIKHANSINEVKNLNINDFYCRYLVVDDIWIPLAESLLIEMFSPLWNRKLTGFGNNDAGSGRHNQKRSSWDIIHPGRAWVENLKQPDITPETISKDVLSYIDQVDKTQK